MNQTQDDRRKILVGWGPIRAWFVAQEQPFSMKTLKKWRREAGLPVHRREGYREVHAYPDELWDWLVRERFGKEE